MLLDRLNPASVVCVVVAAIRERPESLLHVLASRGVPVLTQPRRASADYAAFVHAFSGHKPDLLLCNSYSMKVGPEIIDVVQGNAINAHGALLPRNRGPNPIQWAIIHGDTVTGATLHYMCDEIDAGDIVAQRPVPIGSDDTWITVRDRVNVALRDLIAAEMPRILAGTNARVPQDRARATVNARLTPDSPRIDFDTMTDNDIHNLVRAQVAPLAGAYVVLANGERRRFTAKLSLAQIANMRAQYARE